MRLSNLFTNRTVKRTTALGTAAAVCTAALFAAVASVGALAAPPLVIKEQGARAFGGTVIGELDDQSLHCDHGYIEWQIPPNPRKLPLLMIHASSMKTWETTFDGRDGFKNIFLRRGFAVYQTDLPWIGRAGQACAPYSYEPDIGRDQFFAIPVFRYGTWPPGDPTPNFYPNVQFPVNDEEALNQLLRSQYPEFHSPTHLQIETDALGVLLGEIGRSIMLTHSSTGIRGWITAAKSENAAAIVSYEPIDFVFPEGEAPPALHPPVGGEEINPLTEIPLSDFLKLTEIPIQIVWGDNLDSLEFWRIRLIYSQQFANAINAHGGDAEVLILPDIGIFGNTHFPMSDLNNVKVANLLAQYLRQKGLSSR